MSKVKGRVGVRALFAILAAALMFAVSVSQAAFIPWTTPTISSANFTLSNGGSEKGLFGDPTISGNNISFSPSNFLAESVNGKSSIKSDRLQFDITATTGQKIIGIVISESGKYGIDGTGRVSAGSAIFLTNLTTAELRSKKFLMDPTMPISTPVTNGLWEGTVEMGDLNWSKLRVVLNSNLLAISSDGGSTWINKTLFGSGLSINVMIPEPATVGILTLGSMVIPMIGRKRVKA